MIKHVAVVAAVLGVALSANAQGFSQQTVDTGILPNLMPGHNACLDRGTLGSHMCEPVAALLRAVEPPPAGDRPVISAAAVLQLCGAHNIRDAVCGMAALLELRYRRVPCWQENKC